MSNLVCCRCFKFRFNSCINVSSFIERRQSQANLKTAIDDSKVLKRKLPTLYVPARYAGEVYQIVKPLINAQFILDNITKIKSSCDLRGIEFDYEYAISVIKEWVTKVDAYRRFEENEQEYISERLKSNEQFNNELKENRKLFSKELKTLKNEYYDIEDIAIPVFHSIPNILDPNVPRELNLIEFCEGPRSDVIVLSHCELGKLLSLIEFSSVSPTSYFLFGKLSELDFASQLYFSEKFRSYGFAPLSCMDFCKSFIIEAIGRNPHSNDDCISLKETRDSYQKLNLVGGASLEAFCAYLTNMNADKTTLPLKYISLGRRYNAQNMNSISQNLFSVVQSNNIHCLVLCDASSESNVFNSLCSLLLSCYSDLKIPFRVVEVSAKNLSVTESRRKQLELYSPVLKEHLPVAHVSQHNDFISKRLQITYGIDHVIEGYCCIVEGVAVNISTLIGCIIENLQTRDNDFKVPIVLKHYMDSLLV